MARPRKYGYDCTTISLYLSNDVVAKLNRLCNKKGMIKSKLISLLINEKHTEEEKTIEKEADDILSEHLGGFPLYNGKLNMKNEEKEDS